MTIQETIQSQYQAALEMLRQAIVDCPAALWDDPARRNRFWHVAYHALFYTHLYLQPVEGDFTPWEKHKENYQFMGPLPWPPHEEPEIGEPYSQADVLAYLDLCRTQVIEQIPALNLDDGASGFSWLPFGKLELQFYNLRHLQHHAGELCDRLGAANIDVEWVGMKRKD